MRRLEHAGFEVVACCGPSQEHTTSSFFDVKTRVIQCLSIEGWTSVFRSCAAVVAVDSGPLHLADAIGVPVVGLYGTGALPLWGPSGPRSKAVHHHDSVGFQPIHPVWENIAGGQKLMGLITVDEVMDALSQIMGTEALDES